MRNLEDANQHVPKPLLELALQVSVKHLYPKMLKYSDT